MQVAPCCIDCLVSAFASMTINYQPSVPLLAGKALFARPMAVAARHGVEVATFAVRFGDVRPDDRGESTTFVRVEEKLGSMPEKRNEASIVTTRQASVCAGFLDPTSAASVNISLQWILFLCLYRLYRRCWKLVGSGGPFMSVAERSRKMSRKISFRHGCGGGTVAM